MIFAIFPFMVMFFSKLALKSEIIDRNKFIGVISGFIGIYLIFSDDLSFDFSNYLWGMLAVLGSATLQAFSAVAIKKYGKHLNPISMNFLPVTIGGILLLASGVLFEDLSKIKIDGKAVASILYLALFGTLITFTIYYWLLKKINIVILSLSSFITPIIAVFLGWLLLNESLQKNDIYGSL
ncbi:MAG: multidrug DMT transporter permease, partial [Ignavibacteriales bacterium CG_4_9_14_3_um_filter_34_10]